MNRRKLGASFRQTTRLETVPRQSEAIIIPSLYLMARTEVPVTIGCLSEL